MVEPGSSWEGAGLLRPTPTRVSVSRRQLLLGTASAFFLTACSPGRLQSAPGTGAAAPTATSLAQGATTADAFFSRSEFFIAHRGSYDNWPEHTMKAYMGSVAAGAEALEVSVNATSDGVLVCHHDPTTARNADQLVTIAQTTWAQLADVPVDAREWLGPRTPLEPIPQLKAVLDTFAADRVLLIEDKQGDNTSVLLDMMDSYPDSRQHLVWKQWAAAGQWRAAKERGYLRWGYFTTDIMDRVDELAPNFDFLGVPVGSTDEQIAELVATGKPVIAYEVHTRAVRGRMARLGVKGMMCSNIPYVTRDDAAATADSFGTGLRAAGDLPWTTSKGSAYQPALDVITASLSISHQGVQSYSMGSMCPVARDSYDLTVELRWPEALPDVGQHVGIAFGLQDDSPYRVLLPSAIGGYHMVIRSNGLLELFKRDPHTSSGTSLGSRPTAKPVVGQWMTFTISVSADRLRVVRDGLPTWQIEVDDSTFRGGYHALCKNYASTVPVEFRAVSVS